MSSKQQKPCFAFGRGQCKYGDRCHYSHALVGGRPRPSLPCRFFTTREGCKRGEECTYSHDNPGQGSSTVTQPQASQEDTKVEQKFREWRYQIQKSSTDRQLRNALGRFFATGRDILVAGGPSTKQQIITQLATEGGLYRVKELTDRCSIAETDPQLFENALLPFFQTLTHPNVASSLILEAPLDTIHNFLFGTGGRRGVALFKFTTRNLSDISAEDDNGKSIAVALVACLGVLQKIIDLNGTAQVMEDFHPVVEVMSACLGDTSKEANLSVQSARHNLSRIKARLGLGTSMPSAGTKPQSDGKAQATFLLRQELPGLLCSEGPRHDNDHENICDITILPTAQEIQSHRLEYLPVKDQAHSPGIPGLLDRQFRLLREDTVGQLRDAVRLEIERLQGIDGSEALPKSQQGARTIVHHHVQLRDLTIDKRNGLHIVAEFDQPANLGKASFKERSEWWQHCKQLQIDSLLCLADSDGGSIFLSVCARNEKPQNQYAIPSDTTDILRVDSDRKGKQTAIKQGSETADWRANDRLNNNYVQLGPPQSLSDNPTRAVITLRLAEMNKRNVIQLQQRYNSGHSGPQSLVEFPGILLPSFRPTLIALQQMSRRGDLPFSEFIAPTVETPGMMHVPPPAYSLQTGFRFKLGAVTNGEDLSLSPNERFDFQTLNQNSTLDDAQQVAFVDALTRRLALIQGPPGTGKSFTGVALVKVLLQNREEAALGPIICVCFTNHALDQLLEQLLAHGVEQLIRMGSRSQSESLQELNLRNIAQKADETKTEKHTRFLCQQKLAEQIQEIELLLTDLKHSNSVASIRKHLQEHYYQHYQELFGEDEDGWQTVHHRPENIITDWIRRGSFQHHRRTVRHVEELLEAQLEEISAAERECLHQHWIFEITSELQEYLLSSLESYRLTKEELDHCHQELNLRCLQQAHVIGVTTSGLARNMDLLRRLNSKVLLCEEAGEVLEAHTLTALLPSIQHAILIGDHEQLRPQIQNYELQHDNPRGEKFSLDISLFERLVRLNNGSQIPFSTLQTQRRMHPSIADLVRNTIYPHLLDYPAVHDYPKVLGLRKRRFWLDHQEPEAGADTSQPTSVSKSNDFEVEMTAALVSHLVRQGIYQSDDIAVLTPYLGQLQKLRKRLSSSFEIVVGDRDAEELEREGLETTSQNPGVSVARKSTLLKALRLATIDNFQGEEAKVVVISLVRSNKAGNCGFLRTSNRINVLLSRARHGMYLIGNSQTYGHVPMWAEVLDILTQEGDIGQSLSLCCPRHPDLSIEISIPDDFVRLAPEGGCNAKCKLRLSCGHSCVNKCHSDPLHDATVCLEPCPRPRPECDHPCSKACGEPCPAKCEYSVWNVTLPCGHIKEELACWKARDPSKVGCQEKVQKIVPHCEHTVRVPCSKSVTSEDFKCPAICDINLPCGHLCQRPCKDCKVSTNEGNVGRDHGTCETPCGRNFSTCKHRCTRPCHPGEECPPCEAACEVQCSHSKCNKKCREPCAPCAQACTWSCPHRGRCQLPCAVPCDLIPCSRRCQEILTCGHQCPSLCGENCPSSKYCQICAPSTIKQMMVDYFESLTYEEIDLDEQPCIVPSCGHIMTVGSMDGHMGMSDHYIFAPDGSIKDLKAVSVPFTADLKSCPICRAPFRDTNRYGRIVRRGLLDESTKKFITWSNSQFYPLTERMHTEEQVLRELDNETNGPSQRSIATMATASVDSIHLENSRAQQITTILGLGPQVKKRYKGIILLRKDISSFLHRVSETEQPFGRIYEMVTDLRRRHSLTCTMEYPSNVLQVRNRLLVTVLAVRCDFAILSDFLAFKRTMAARGELQQRGDWATADLHIDLSANRKECEDMVAEAVTRAQPMHQVEGHLYFARFAALERSNKAAEGDQLRTEAQEHLEQARLVCEKHPGQTAGMAQEITDVETMLREGVFYTEVTNEEKRQIYAAMAREFVTTGHWYRCANGHPFTIGECGGAMQVSSCPVCGVAIGGSNHETVEGVTAAHDFDEQFGRMRL